MRRLILVSMQGHTLDPLPDVSGEHLPNEVGSYFGRQHSAAHHFGC